MSHLAALKGIDSPLSASDHYFTPGDLLAQFHAEFRFTLDVASHPEAASNALIGRAYCWREKDGLKEPWAGERVWWHKRRGRTDRAFLLSSDWRRPLTLKEAEAILAEAGR